MNSSLPGWGLISISMPRFLNAVVFSYLWDNLIAEKLNDTRMHSSRMRTARLCIVPGCWGVGRSMTFPSWGEGVVLSRGGAGMVG